MAELFEKSEMYVFRCLVGDGVVDVIAESEADAEQKTGSTIIRKIYRHPIPTLEEMRSQWPKGSKDEGWLKEMESWMVAAVLTEMIDSEKFEEIEKSVKDALHRLKVGKDEAWL